MNTAAIAGGVESDQLRSSEHIKSKSRSARAATTLAIARATAVLFFSLCALAQMAVVLPFVNRQHRLCTRAVWLHTWCRFACRLLGVHVTARGAIPRSGLLVCNHLSYLDVIALSSITPCVFIAKRDVASWPLFGGLARAAGTIFVDRRSKLAAARAVGGIREAIATGVVVVLFAEGTSSDGATVLPFKSALLEPALQVGCEISVTSIDYSLSCGSVADEVCYWRDMTLVPHLLNLFTKPVIKSQLTLASFTPNCVDRKQIARTLRAQIIAIRS